MSDGSFTDFSCSLLFNGYFPTYNTDLVDNINANKPFDVSSLIFIGVQDSDFYQTGVDLSNENLFNYQEVIESQDAGHHLPYSSDSTFSSVIDFINNQS